MDSKATCDQRVDASTRTIKYRNGPHSGLIGPQILPWILYRNGMVCLESLAKDGLAVNLASEQALQNER